MFLILTEKETRLRVLVNISQITSIVECEDDSAFIETAVEDEEYSRGFYTKERFDDIFDILSDQIKIN